LAKVTVSCPDWREAAVPPLTFELPTLAVPMKHYAELKGVKSMESKVETSIKFINRSKQTVKVYWINHDGNRDLRGTLRDGEAYVPKRTFLTHPWLITDGDDNAWYVFFPDAQPRTLEIVEPEDRRFMRN
jgi:hypothetical protein